MSCCWMVGVGMTDFILNVPDEEFVRGVREGRKSERERIIHLLHNNIGWCEALEYESFADQLEELIKGENK